MSGLDRVAVVGPPRSIPEFQLSDQDGKPFSSSSLRGRPALVFHVTFFKINRAPMPAPTRSTTAGISTSVDDGGELPTELYDPAVETIATAVPCRDMRAHHWRRNASRR